jgi:hypothetical protein
MTETQTPCPTCRLPMGMRKSPHLAPVCGNRRCDQFGLRSPAPLFEVPNLDGMDAADLADAETVFNRLAAVAGYKALAMRHRAAGDIEAARSHEACAEAQYRKLPQWAKW